MTKFLSSVLYILYKEFSKYFNIFNKLFVYNKCLKEKK